MSLPLSSVDRPDAPAPSARFGAAILLLACCGCGRTGTDGADPARIQYLADRRTAICEARARCGQVGESEVSACGAFLEKYQSEPIDAHLVDPNRYSFDAKSAADCIAGIENLSCDLLKSWSDFFNRGLDFFPPCSLVFGPARDPGADCFYDGECKGGFCLMRSCTGTCRAFTPIGSGPCCNFNQDPDCDVSMGLCDPAVAQCDPDRHVCRLPPGRGEPCSTQLFCAQGLECHFGVGCCDGTCGDLTPSQIDCYPFDCPVNTRCIPGFSPDTPVRCKPLAPVGAGCITDEDCQDGLYCQLSGDCGQPHFACARRAAAGESCGGAVCDSILCQPDTWCSNSVCVPVRAVGDSCMSSAECPYGTDCNAPERRCTGRPLVGEPCDPSSLDHCWKSDCDPATMRCVVNCR